MNLLFLTSFLEFGGWIFWCLVATAIIVVLINIENERGANLFWPCMVVLVLGILFAGIYKTEFRELFERIDSRIVVYSIIGYIVAGIGWSFFKWLRFIDKKYKEFETKFEQVKNENLKIEKDIKSIEEGSSTYRKGYCPQLKELPTIEHYIPLAKENKEQLSTWIAFWPFSGLRYLIGNALVDFFHWIAEAFSGWYDGLSYRRFNKSKDTFKLP